MEPAAGSTKHVAGSGVLPEVPRSNEALRNAIDAALADAARRTGRDAASLKLVSVEAVVWPDGGLGCPEPGVVYTMAPVPGYRIRVRAEERLLDYHASRQGNLVLCPPGRSSDPLPSAVM